VFKSPGPINFSTKLPKKGPTTFSLLECSKTQSVAIPAPNKLLIYIPLSQLPFKHQKVLPINVAILSNGEFLMSNLLDFNTLIKYLTM